MYDVLTGKQRALVFPVMCNGFVKIDYSDNVPNSADDVGYGIWSHSGDFTFEAIVTPYDINGALNTTLRGRTLTASTKIMPNSGHESTLTNFQSEQYLPLADRMSHEMRIFSSTNFYISLKNSTTTTANQPAEYKILVGIKLSSGAVQEFITDNAVILPTKDRAWTHSTSSLSGFNQEGRIEYEIAATLNSAFSSGGSVLNCIAVDANTISDDEPLFIRDGYDFTAIGTVSSTNTSANTITLSSAYGADIADEALIYRKTYADPTYIENSFHIACTYAETAKELNIYLNGLLVKVGTHAESGTFSFEDENLFIGATGGGSHSLGGIGTKSNKQFMGEMHEMCLSSVIRRRFPSITNLHPNFNDTLFYFRFEEVDL